MTAAMVYVVQRVSKNLEAIHWSGDDICKRRKKNPYDRFANSGSAKIPGKIGRVVVGHIPRELSRYMWHPLDSGAIISGKVISDKFKSSPLFQGGLEILIKVLVSWSDEKSMTILKEKVKSVNYTCGIDYVDD